MQMWKPFFPTTSRISETFWQRSKNPQNRVFVGCFYAEANLQFQCISYVKCFSRFAFYPYVQFQASDTLLQKKFQREFIIIQMGVYNTGFHFSTFFQVTGKWVNYSDNFFPAGHDYQIHFFLSRLALPKFYVKSLKRIMKTGIFR